MTGHNSVLSWPEGDQAKAPSHPHIERFKNGSRKTVLLLGDPVKRQMHWNADLKKSVPCFKPVPCPFCSDPKFVRTTRTEGFAPVMVLNPALRQWEQAVAVFTAGGLSKLAEIGPGPYRGWTLDICKVQEQPGRTSPMTVKRLEQLPESFPSLPPDFSVKAVMLRVWFPEMEHAEPIQWIEPIKVERRPKPASTVATMELDPEEAALLAERARKMGLHNYAKTIQAKPMPAAAEAGAQAEMVENGMRGWDTPPVAAPTTSLPTPAPEEPAPEKKIGALALHELLTNPDNYAPPALAGVGTEDKPLIDPPAEEGKLLTRASVKTLAESRSAARANNSPAARRAAAENGRDKLVSDRLVGSEEAFAELGAVLPTPKKGGTK